MKAKRQSGLLVGHDAFLDIVANLVGILIILVVILGARSHQLAEQVQPEPVSEEVVALAQRELQAVSSVDRDVAKLEKSINVYDAEIAARKKERDSLLLLRDAAQKGWEQALEKSSEQQKRLSELERQRQLAASELEGLQLQSTEMMKLPDKLIAVQHLPTPMAKTVFGDEIHFRLKDKRLAYVPLEELLQEIKEDFHRLASVRARNQNSSVGPIRDFVARYEMTVSRQTVTQSGQIGYAARATVGELIIEPLNEPIGEPMPASLQPESQLAFELAGRDPASTTVTVWVYPDSFAEFRQLKEYLYKLGFATAARPLPEGHPIAGSPHGSRSQSQ